MKAEDKKSLYWTGGLVGMIIIALVILWALGVFEAETMPAQ